MKLDFQNGEGAILFAAAAAAINGRFLSIEKSVVRRFNSFLGRSELFVFVV